MSKLDLRNVEKVYEGDRRGAERMSREREPEIEGEGGDRRGEREGEQAMKEQEIEEQ